MPGPIDFQKLSLALDRAETMLSTEAEAINAGAAADLRVRIARARAELDFLIALASARSSAKLSPLWMQLPGAAASTGDPGL